MTKKITESIYGQGSLDITTLENYTPWARSVGDIATLTGVVSMADEGPNLVPFVQDDRSEYYDHFPYCPDWETLKLYYPDLTVDRTYGWGSPTIKEGMRCLVLIGIHIRDSTSAFIHQFRDLSGQPWEGLRVGIMWPEADLAQPPETFRPPYHTGESGYAANTGAAGWTGPNGDIGFGWSADGGYSHIFFTWPFTPAPPIDYYQQVGYADALKYYGAMGGTNRNTVTGIWQEYEYVKSNGTTPPPSIPGSRLVVYLNGEQVMYFVGSEAGNQNNGMFLEDAEGNKSLFFPGFQI